MKRGLKGMRYAEHKSKYNMPQWKEDWKVLSRMAGAGGFCQPQWKEDWKELKTQQTILSSHASMKRGLKENIFPAVALAISLGLNEKRIESIPAFPLQICYTFSPQWKEDWKLQVCILLHIWLLCCLNEKRIESRTEGLKPSGEHQPQWKEDWKFSSLAFCSALSKSASMKRGLKVFHLITCASYSSLTPQWKEDWKSKSTFLPPQLLYYASMKRGLKVSIPKTPRPVKTAPPQWKEDWKRMERKKGLKRLLVSLNEKRIESPLIPPLCWKRPSFASMKRGLKG